MFTEKIKEITDRPAVFAEQKMTAPTARLTRVLAASQAAGFNLVNLTYLGAPFVDPSRGSFDLAKPRLLTSSGFRCPSIATRFGTTGDLRLANGQTLFSYMKGLSSLRAGSWDLTLEQIRWLLEPQEFDMTDFYLDVSGIDSPTRASIVEMYLPQYYRELGESGIPLVTDFDKKSERSKKLIRENGVCVIDVPDRTPELISGWTPPKDVSERSYIDLTNAEPELVELALKGEVLYV